MPRFRPFRPDGGEYVLRADRPLPPDQRVIWHHRDPLPSEVARLESEAGYLDLADLDIGRAGSAGEGVGARAVGRARWVSNGPANAIRALLLLLTDVTGPGPEGHPLRWPAGGTEKEREAFLALFLQADLYEVAEAVVERGHLTEGERGNSEPPPKS